MTEVAQDPGDTEPLADDAVKEIARRITRAVVRRLAVLIVALVLMVAALAGVAWSNHSNGCTFRTKHNLLVDKIENGARNIIPADATQQQRDAIETYVATIEVARVKGC